MCQLKSAEIDLLWALEDGDRWVELLDLHRIDILSTDRCLRFSMKR